MAPQAEARDVSRYLGKMVGYTIIDAAAIQRVNNGDVGNKVVVLDNGRVFKVQMLLLPPLPLTDVIIFGKKVQGSELVLIKLLIDNEAYVAVIVN